MIINDLKEKIDNLIENGYGNLEIYKDGGDGCADRIIKLRFQLLYEGKFYPTDRENNMYKNILDSRIEDIFKYGEWVIRFL